MIIDRFSPARRISRRRTDRRMLSVAACVVLASAARAQVTSYTNLAAFQSAAPSTVLRATFESFPIGQVNDIAEGGLSFSNNGGGPLYILDPGLGGTSPAPLSKILTGNGNERFDITFGGTNPFAVGFDTYTNFSLPPEISVFDGSNTLIGSFTLAQGPNTFGFFGVTSTTPIGRVLWSATNGNLDNTAIDNVRTGSVASSAPEPGSIALALAGALPLAGVVLRRRRAA